MSRKFKRESADYAKHCRNKTVMRLTELPPSFVRSLGKYLVIGNRGYKNEVREGGFSLSSLRLQSVGIHRLQARGLLF